ncbi:MAG: hypothetical protein ACE5OZ_20255 [Candidatus Heimdallarchaeota archaeon]
MAIKTENPTQMMLFLAIIGGLIFFGLNVFVPYFKVGFGYLEYQGDAEQFEADTTFYASEAEADFLGLSIGVDYDDVYPESDYELLWTMLHFWQYILLFGGLAALALVIIPPVMDIQGAEQPFKNMGLIGFLIGAVASGVEWLLFISLWMLEDWEGAQPDLGIILLILNWIGLMMLFLASQPSLLVKELVKE